MAAVLESNIPGYPVRRGKVRDVYELDAARLLIVATDRISAFDVIMPTPIPDKGAILTRLSNFWFGFFGREVAGLKHHLIETEFAKFPAALKKFPELAGRSVIVRKTAVIPIECVVRGYITGSGWKDYQKTGMVSGVKLPAGLKQCEQLPVAIFTPSTKAASGHDMPISIEAAAELVGKDVISRARDLTIELYTKAAAYAKTRGIIIADTKFEFGLEAGSREPMLIDEALTPDSSRFWPADQYAPGRDQPSFDKQYVRNYLETLAWDKTPPGPELPGEVVAGTRAKYVEAYERLTGEKF